MTTRRSMLVLGMSVTIAAAANHAEASSIVITNAGFETPAIGNNTFQLGSFAGWLVTPSLVSTTADGGVFDPGAQYPGAIPEGENVAFSSDGLAFGWSSGILSQVLTATLASSTMYTLQVDVGDRLDTILTGYLIELLAGSTVLASDNSSLAPVSGFLTSTIQFQSGASPAELGQTLQIRLRLIGSQVGQVAQVNFDNVRLDATLVDASVPEPTTLLLLGSGLAAAGLRRRKTRSADRRV